MMQTLSGIHKGPLVLANEEFLFTGIARGDLTVEQDATVELRGMVHGDVLLRGGHLKLTGMVRGNIVNEGGTLEISGMVSGSVLSPGGSTTRGAHAVCRL